MRPAPGFGAVGGWIVEVGTGTAVVSVSEAAGAGAPVGSVVGRS